MTDRLILPGLSDDEDRILNHLLNELDEKQPRNLLRASYYDGKRAIRQVGSIIPPQYYRLGIVLGWSAKAVDILSRRTNLDTFVWPDGDLADIGFSETWEGNGLGTEVSSGLISSLIHGTAFLVNTLGDESAGEAKGLIHVKDAMSATGDWNPRTRRLDNLLSITGRDDGKPTSLALYLDGLTITAEHDSSGWTIDRSEHSWGVPAEPLVYKPRVGRPFGSSRISRPVMSIHDQGLREVIRLEGHMDVYSFPEMWLLGADEAMFKNPDGSQKAAWQIMLGRIKAIPDDEDAVNPRADVKQFAASSPEPHLAHLNGLAKMFAREASLPDTSVAISDIANPTSAESYDASQHELIAEAEGATDDWAPPLRRALVRALAMQNDLAEIPPEWATIDTKWRPPQFLSRASQADAGSKQVAAIPWLAETEVGLELLGLDAQQIKRAMSEKRKQRGSGVLDALRGAANAVTSTESAADLKAKYDALGSAIRSGVSPADAAASLGLPVTFTGATPVSLRLPAADAAVLEQL